MLKIYYNYERQCTVTAGGGRLTQRPEIVFTEKPVWELQLVDNRNEPLNLVDGVAWRAAVGNQFNAPDNVMCRSLADAIDHSRRFQGILRIALNAATDTFREALGVKEKIAAYFELWGYNNAGDQAYYLIIPIEARMAIDPIPGPVPLPVESGVDKAWVEAKIATLKIPKDLTELSDEHHLLTDFDTIKKLALKQALIFS